MSNNYPPQGPGQPPYGQPPTNPGQYNPPPNPGQYNPPPVAPTQPVNYGPPPGNIPNGYSNQPPQPGQPYPPRPYAGPPKRKTSPAGIVVIVIVAIVIVGAVVGGLLGVFNNVEATDYPGATKATLTDKGTTYVNSLYNDNSSDRDNRKIFLTADTPDKVFAYYKADLVKKGWTFDKDGELDGVSGSQFHKSGDLILVLSGTPDQGFIQNEGTQNFIIVVTGKDTTT